MNSRWASLNLMVGKRLECIFLGQMTQSASFHPHESVHMSKSPKRNENSKIETLEQLILMSASGLDAEVETADLVSIETSPKELGEEAFVGEILGADLLAEDGEAAEETFIGIGGFDTSNITETESTPGDGEGKSPFPELEIPSEIQTDPLMADLLSPIELGDPRIAESGLAEGDINSEIDQFDEGVIDVETPPEFLELAASAEGASFNVAADSTGGSDTAAEVQTVAASAPYSKYIVLNGDDNDAVLEVNGDPLDDLVQLRSTNGTFETIVFQLPTDVLAIELGDGNDTLVVDGLDLRTLTADVFIYGQGGDDSITLNSLETVNDVYVYDLDGNNDFNSRRLNIGGDLFISDGDGDQTVGVLGTVNGNVNIGSTSGDSRIILGSAGVEPALVRGSVTIDNMGLGDDFVRLSGRVVGDFYVDAGDGEFELTSIFSSVGGALFTNVDNGDSTIFLGDFSAGEASYFSSAEGDTDTWLTAAFFNDGLTIQNGLGFDELKLDGASISTEASGGVPGLLTVYNGDGGSLTALNRASRIFSLRIDGFRLHNGLGTDTIEINLRDRDTLNTFYAENGDGDTTVDITGVGSMQAGAFISGEGTDNFTLDGVDIENDLIIDTGNGESTVDIQNSEIGNLQTSGASGIETVYGDGDDEIYAAVGNNVIDGGAGDDVLVVYEGTSADFDITYEADGRVIVEGPGLNGETVRNELINVERILFNDKLIYLSDPDDPNDPDVPTTMGTDGNDWIALPEPGGNVEAGGGDDFIYAPVGLINEIDGGSGTDTLVIYEGGQADYIVRRRSDSLAVEVEGPGLNGSTVVNRLSDVEFILFTDGIVNVADVEITPEGA